MKEDKDFTRFMTGIGCRIQVIHETNLNSSKTAIRKIWKDAGGHQALVLGTWPNVLVVSGGKLHTHGGMGSQWTTDT